MKKIWLTLALIIISDQITKALANTYISPLRPIKLLPFLQLVNVRNEGAAFGLMSALGNKFFIVVSFIAIGFIIALLIKNKDSILSLALILGGAVGNLIDRLFLGYVRDFIDVFIGRYHWPAFNVADSSLTIGIFLLIVSPLFKKTRRHPK